MDVFLYVPRMIIDLMDKVIFDFGFMEFSSMEWLIMILLVSEVIYFIRKILGGGYGDF